jgi:hypothetical protein|tara:strand:+ start:1639 stop:3300 length:1662 start_codon:yes stop_codon:yes gene_type:complete
VVNVSNENQSFTIILDDGKRQIINEKFLLDNFFNFLFYRSQGATSTKEQINGEKKYFRVRYLRDLIGNSKNTALFTQAQKESYRKFLKDTFELLLTDVSESSKRLKDSGIPQEIKPFIENQPLEKLLDDDFIQSISPVYEKDEQVGADGGERRRKLDKVAEGFGNDEDEYIKGLITKNGNIIELDESIVDRPLNKRKKLIESGIGVRSELKENREVANGKMGVRKTTRVEVDGEEITLSSGEKLILKNLDNFFKEWFDGLEITKDEDIDLTDKEAPSVFLEYQKALDGIGQSIKEDYLTPLYQKYKKSIDGDEEELLSEDTDAMSYSEWAEKNEVNDAMQNIVLYIKHKTFAALQKQGISSAKLKPKTKSEDDTTKQLAFKKLIDFTNFRTNYKNKTKLVDFKSELIDEIVNIEGIKMGDKVVEYSSAFIGKDGQETNWGEILRGVKTSDTDLPENVKDEIVNYVTNIINGNPFNDLLSFYKLRFDLGKKEWKLTLIVRINPTKGEEITAKRGQLKFPKAKEMGTIPNNLLTMFNSLVNLFRKNVRVTKRALR